MLLKINRQRRIQRSDILWLVQATLVVIPLVLLWFRPVQASEAQIAIIIDDMGYSYSRGKDALAIEADLTYAFLPHAPHTQRLSRLANRKRKEIVVHLPMQAMMGNELDEGALKMDMERRVFYETLLRDLDSVPHAVGVNNHMGSLLTQHPGIMKWLMVGLKSYGGLYFIDSRTSENSIAAHIAAEKGVKTAIRDIFLDHKRDERSIENQFKVLMKQASKRGHAIGIGHPYPETLAVLQRMIPRLKQKGITLVKASTLVSIDHKRLKQWHASLSHLPKVVKNSKL